MNSGKLVQAPNVFCHMATFLDIYGHANLLAVCKSTRELCCEHRSVCENVNFEKNVLPLKLVKRYVTSRTKYVNMYVRTGKRGGQKNVRDGFNRSLTKKVLLETVYSCRILEKLDIIIRDANELKMITQLPSLTSLTLKIPHENDIFIDLTVLGDLVNLEELDLRKMGNCTRIHFLDKLKKLHTLSLPSYRLDDKKEDYASLTSLPLRKLTLRDSSRGYSYTCAKALEKMHSLHTLILYDCKSNFLEELVAHNLQELYVSMKESYNFNHTQLRLTLVGCPNITVLHIKNVSLEGENFSLFVGTKVTELSILKNMQYLWDPVVKKVNMYIDDDAIEHLVKTNIKKLTLDCHRFSEAGLEKLASAGILLISK